jgi:lipid II:glycine glycyltransferase (peptidoglycan interpeptide bridge formation enzyme)
MASQSQEHIGKLSAVGGAKDVDLTKPGRSNNGALKTSQAKTGAGYETVLSHEPADPQWDSFLNQVPGTYFAQSSLWAEVKAFQGWRTLRLTVKRQGEIVAGVQMFMRPWPILGNLGYVSRGPVLETDDPALRARIVDELLHQAGRNRTRALILQPHGLGEGPEELLLAKGFRPTDRAVAPVHTLHLDLSLESDAILAQMKSRTRYNIRVSNRKEITIREGTGADLDGFIRLARMTGERQDFAVPSETFIRQLWERFAPAGHVKLFLAEYQEEIISAQLAIPFGDTVVNKLTVWSGQQGKRKPNEGLLWGAIQWSKDQGYRAYDFGGLSPNGAKYYMNQEPLPEKLKGTVTSFKLGFGGQIIATPRAYMYVSNRLLRRIDKKLLANFEQSKHVKRFANRLRTQ